MKKLVFTLLVMAVSLQLFAGNGQKVTERRQVARFERILLQGSPTIKYTQGSKVSVEVKAPKDIIKNVITRVEGNRLTVSVKNPSKWMFNFGSKDDGVVVYVTSPDLIGIELMGSGDFECNSRLDTDNLNVALKGSGDIELKDVICDKITSSVVGSGDLEIKKVVALSSSVELVGSGDVKINEHQVKQTKVELKGSGDIKLGLVNCGTVDCRLLGSGDITLQGDALSLNSYTRGSGDLHTSGLKLKK